MVIASKYSSQMEFFPSEGPPVPFDPLRPPVIDLFPEIHPDAGECVTELVEGQPADLVALGGLVGELEIDQGIPVPPFLDEGVISPVDELDRPRDALQGRLLPPQERRPLRLAEPDQVPDEGLDDLLLGPGLLLGDSVKRRRRSGSILAKTVVSDLPLVLKGLLSGGPP